MRTTDPTTPQLRQALAQIAEQVFPPSPSMLDVDSTGSAHREALEAIADILDRVGFGPGYAERSRLLDLYLSLSESQKQLLHSAGAAGPGGINLVGGRKRTALSLEKRGLVQVFEGPTPYAMITDLGRKIREADTWLK